MLSRFFKKEKSNVKSQTPKSRRLHMERLEDRALLSVTPLEYAEIRELYSSFELSENMSEVNVIDLNAATTSEQVQAALDAAKATPQDDLLVVRVNSDDHTLTLDGNPLVVDVAPENGGVYIVALADDGSNASLTVDTQNMSRAFSVLRGDVGLANMDIYGQTWSFDQGAAYDGLIRVRNVADLTVENVEIWAAPTASDSPVMGEEEAQGLPGELLVPNADWSLAEPSSDVALSVAGVPTSVSVSAPSAVVAEGPYGAGQYDTSLYMAGNVAVTLAIMESNGAVDASVCNWSTSQINAVKTRTREALDWWETMFDKYNPNSPIGLSFTVDYTDATTPFQTSYEPIMHAGSSEEDLWGCEYLASKGYAATDSTYWNTMCSYNADIRNKTGADWAYTIIVVHSRDPQGNLVGSSSVPGDFAGGGAGAYAWYGGANMLASYDCRGWGIGRMNYTIAHETGHIFHAPDEYEGSGSYYDVSGYYGIQNLNAIEDNPNPDACVPSIMNGEQDYAWKNYTSSPTSLQTIGWRDSDGDGLIDALDTPLILTGRGKYDAGQKTFTFAGKSSVTALENAMTKSDVTLNTVDRLEYKLDDGAWTTLATVSGTSNVSVGGVVNIGDAKLISFRTVCDRTGVTSATLTFNPLDPFNPLDDPLRVTTALDVVDDTDGVISLREALAVAHEGDAVTFAASLKGQTITLNGSEIELSNAVTVDASALWDATTETPGLTIDAGGKSRVFYVRGGTTKNPVELIGLKIADGSAPHAGGVMVHAGAALSAKDCVFVDNKTTGSGGGGLCVDGWADLENCVFSGNSAATDGGGIFVAATGSLTAIGLTVDGNSAAGNGGGIYVDGTATLAKTTISGNAATNQGGGLHVGGATTLEKATISGNSAAWGGGAVVWNNLTLTNSLVVENEATSGGGGFYVGGTAILRNATIAANKAGWGGGLQVGGEEGTTTLYNAILATNVGGDVADGATLNAYNVLSSHTKWDAGSNYYVYNASLPLFKDAANGDYRLADGSQAVDKGNDAHAVDADGNAFPTDLAGNVRFNGTVDLGAYELQGATETPSLVVTTAADVVNINDGLISLREAIQYAAACARLGGVVTFDASLKGATITLSGTELAISQAVTIDASALGDATTKTPGLTLNADGKSRVFNVTGGTEEAPVALLGLTITGGVASYAGGVFVAPNAFLSAQNVVFTGNKTTLSGGGGLCVDGAASLENCDFIGNQGGSGGGICVALTASLTVKGGSFVDNVAAGYGGGGVEIERDAKVVISNATFTGNSAAYGGALHVVGSLTADNLTINGNSGTGSAGVDVDASGTLTLENSTITNNTATNAAGGLYVGGWATVRRVTISGNSAANGGGVYVAGTLTATDVTISDNAASDQGGGLRVNGASTLENATISGNSATWGGGAIVWGTLNLTNALVVENSATSGGGGFYVGGTATFRNATIAANKAGWGGGLQVSNDGTATLYNTILATNDGGDVSDGATLNAYNVLSSHTTWDAGSNNYAYNASQPLFKDAANGDYTLADNSQALNKGNDAYAVDADGNALTTDLAGNPRFAGTVDLGAYEGRQAEPLTAPSLSVSSLDAASISVKFGVVANASGYSLEYSTTANFTSSTTLAQTYSSAGTYALTGLSANTTYYVRVKALSDVASYLGSAWSSVETSTTLKIALTGVTLSGTAQVGEALTASVAPSGATVSWQWYAGPDASSATTAITGATSPTFTPTLAYVGQYLKVVATGTGDYDGSVSATTASAVPAEPLASPSLSVSALSSSSLSVTIGSVANASGYSLEYSTTANFTSSTTLAQTYSSAGTYALTGLSANTTYYVRVKALSDVASYADSAWSSVESSTTLKIALTDVTLSGTVKVGEALTASVAPSGATVSWQWYAGPDASSATTAITGATSPTFTPTLAYVGQYLKVVATGTGDYDGSVSATTASAVPAEPLASPSLSVSALSSSSLSVTIGSVANASGYSLEYSTTANFTSSTTLAQTYSSAGTYALTGLSANTTYYVRVLAKGDGASYVDSAWSSVESSTTLKIALTGVTLSGTAQVGEALTASVSPSGATVSWQWYAGPDASSATTAITGATSPTFTPTLAYVGQYLKVVATGTGDYDGSVSATVDLVPPTAPTDVKFGEYDASEKNATLTWIDAATNEIRYEARYSVDDGATWTTLANLAANATSRVCDDLNVGETYIFQIRAVAANGLASDWASAKFFVAATFGASEYVVEQNCAFYLSASDASDGAPTYYWDLSGSEVEEPSNFIERDAGFWTTVEELGFGVGEHTIRMRARDANGIFGSTVVATLRVVSTTPTIQVTTSSSADGSILRLNLQATTPDGSPVARWRFDWGDGQTSDFAQLSDALTAGHYYAPTAEDAVYDVSLTVVDATGAGGDVVYALTSHEVAGYGAASQATLETVASEAIAEEALSVDAAVGCGAEIVDSRATTNGTKGASMSRIERTSQTSTRRAGLKTLSDAEIRSDSKRFERVDLTAASVSAVLAEEFDELDFFIDEDELDALAKRFIRR